MTNLTQLFLATLTCVAGLGSAHLGGDHHTAERDPSKQIPIGGPSNKLTINGIPYATRVHWMRQANLALHAPCPFAAFGSVIVNHTKTEGLGTVVCTGANANYKFGNPTLHGSLLVSYA
jgi:hypothetical protein